MTRALAPGKLVISGAYAVLEGAPAITTAVDRYAIADSARAATLLTPEVAEALKRPDLRARVAPWFDASRLRQDGRKLGLGSSAAILVASLAALLADSGVDTAQLKREVFARALLAHRLAQGGGSGIDVATSVHGGTLTLWREQEQLHHAPSRLPSRLWLEVWATGNAAATPRMLQSVHALRSRAPADYQRVVAAIARAAEVAVHGMHDDDADAFFHAVIDQTRALRELGGAAGVPIVSDAIWHMLPDLHAQNMTCHPAGAGGGDVCLLLGIEPRPEQPRTLLERAGYERLQIGLGAAGLQLASGTSPE